MMITCRHRIHAVQRPSTTRDRADERVTRADWSRVRRAENSFLRQLRGVAARVDEIVRKAGDPEAPGAAEALAAALARYAEVLRPWSYTVVSRMHADVARRDEAIWNEVAKTMARALRLEIQTAPTGERMRALLDQQSALITSLPIDAAHRVHEWTLRGIEGGARADEVAAEIMRTGHVTRSEANLIARTEVGRTASTLVQARAEHVGSEGYVWRTARDGDVRKSHRAMEGKFIRWDAPPILDGLVGHAGALPSCRCVPEPVIPDVPRY